MIHLVKSLADWRLPTFKVTFKAEVEALDATALPLQQGLSQSSHVSETDFQVMVLNSTEEADKIYIKAAILYAGIVPGCSCSGDPTPETESSEYCEVQFEIDRQTAATTATLLSD